MTSAPKSPRLFQIIRRRTKADQNEWQAAQGRHWRYRLQHGLDRKGDPQNGCPVATKS
jgi:hypothetical protein